MMNNNYGSYGQQGFGGYGQLQQPSLGQQMAAPGPSFDQQQQLQMDPSLLQQQQGMMPAPPATEQQMQQPMQLEQPELGAGMTPAATGGSMAGAVDPTAAGGGEAAAASQAMGRLGGSLQASGGSGPSLADRIVDQYISQGRGAF